MYIRKIRKFFTPIAVDNFASTNFLSFSSLSRAFLRLCFYESLMLKVFSSFSFTEVSKSRAPALRVHKIHFITHFKEFSILHMIFRLW